MSGERKRDYRGRFLKKLRPTPDGSREWFIWSKYHRCWHRRSSRGGACGYTSDVAEAGLFDRAVASQYNDDRDEPFHASEVETKLTAALARHDEARENLAFALARTRPAQSSPSMEKQP